MAPGPTAWPRVLGRRWRSPWPTAVLCPVGGDSRAHTSLNPPGALWVRTDTGPGPGDSLSAGNGTGQGDQETRPPHRGKVQRRRHRERQPNALELTVSARHRRWHFGPEISSEPWKWKFNKQSCKGRYKNLFSLCACARGFVYFSIIT